MWDDCFSSDPEVCQRLVNILCDDMWKYYSRGICVYNLLREKKLVKGYDLNVIHEALVFCSTCRVKFVI